MTMELLFVTFVITYRITNIITMSKTDYIRIRIHPEDKEAFKDYAIKKNRDMSELLVDHIKKTIRNGKK